MKVTYKSAFLSLMALAVVSFSSAGAMAANKLIVKDATGTTDKFVVTDEGRIGIGTSAPKFPIAVQANGNWTLSSLEFLHTGNTTWAAADAPAIRLMRINVPAENNGVPKPDDRLGALMFGTYFGTAAKFAAFMTGNAEGAWTSTSTPGYLAFRTTSTGATSPTERVRITSTGNVGIGTTAPTQKLVVNGNIRIIGTGTPPDPAECTTANRGTLKFVTGATDELYLCAAADTAGLVWKKVNLQ